MKARTMFQRLGKSDEKGFTLIEVLVAMGVFAVGILAMFSMQSAVVKANSLARNSTEAATFAADLLERLNSLPYDDPNYLAPGVYTEAGNELREGQFSAVSGGNLVPNVGIYRFRYTVQQDFMIPNTKTITIRVYYRYGGGNWNPFTRDTRHVELVSIKPDTIL